MSGKPALEYQDVTYHKDSKTCDKMMGDRKLLISAEVDCKRRYWHFDSMTSDTTPIRRIFLILRLFPIVRNKIQKSGNTTLIILLFNWISVLRGKEVG
jgi:hypothetical protein